jgi:O-antigen/teichoic acid export membrane protein
LSSQLFRQLSRESFIYGLSAGAAKLIGFILVPLYTRLLTQSDYGYFDLLVTGMAVLSSVVILGMDTSVAMLFYQTDDANERRKVTSTVLFFELVLTTAVAAILFLLAEPLANVALGNSTYVRQVQLAVLTIPFAVLMTMFLDITRLLRMPPRYLVLAVGNLLVTTVLIIGAVVFLQLGVVGILWATLLGNGVFSLVAWLSTRGQFGWHFSVQILRHLVTLGAPLALASIALWVVGFSNRWFLLHLTSSPEQVAVYALASKLVAPIVLMVTAFQIAWVPFSLSIARNTAALPVYARTVLYLLTATFGVLLVITLWSEPLVRVFSTDAYLPASQIIALVGATSIATGLYFIVSTGLNLAGKTLHVSWITVVAAAVGIGLNLLLIPSIGVVGAAIAALAAALTPVILIYVIAQRLYRIPYDLIRILVLSCIAASLLAGATLLRMGDPGLDFGLRLIMVLLFVASLVPIGVVREHEVDEVRRLLRRVVGRWGGI